MKSELETLQKKLEDLQGEAAELQTEIGNFELDEDDYEEQYIDMIDEESPIIVAGMSFNASRILQELDPIAFSCGLSDFVDGIDKDDCPEYKELEEKLADLESEIETLEEEIEELEAELEDN